MFSVILFGLLAAVKVHGDEDQLDSSERLRIPNNFRWFPQGYRTSLESNSSERPVTRARCHCGRANREASRIIGGTVHAPNEYPFVAGISYSKDPNDPHCGAAIISPWHILTVAHCINLGSAKSLVVTLGDYDRSGRSGPLQHIFVKWIFMHEKYDKITMRNDISLLFLQWPITYNKHVGIVCMPTFPMDLVGEHVRIMGWGAKRLNSSMTILPQQIDTRVVDISLCQQAFQSILSNPVTQICTHSQGKTTCQGDSGSPVVYLNPDTNRYVLVGLVSFGRLCQDNIPTVQTSVAAYLPWINNIIQSTTPNQHICS